METTVVERPAQRTAGFIHVGPYATLGDAFDRLAQWMGRNVEHLRGAPLCGYLDDPERTPAEELRTWVVVPIDDALRLEDGDLPVGPYEVAGGRYYVATHRGTYDGLAQAWGEFMAALATSGHTADWSRHCLEVYVSDPSQTPADELITELLMPIE